MTSDNLTNQRYVLCQMDTFQKQGVCCIASILDSSTKPTPLYLSSSTPATEPHSISPALLFTEIGHLAKLFIMCLMDIPSSVRQRKNE